jgi:hypothetical protein
MFFAFITTMTFTRIVMFTFILTIWLYV